jgi:hypothetical protein
LRTRFQRRPVLAQAIGQNTTGHKMARYTLVTD